MTLDKGIASLLQSPLPQHAGIVLFRPDASDRTAVASFVRSRLPHLLQMELAHRLTVVSAAELLLLFGVLFAPFLPFVFESLLHFGNFNLDHRRLKYPDHEIQPWSLKITRSVVYLIKQD